MRRLAFILFFSFLSIQVFAQPNRPGLARIHAAKIAYITDRLQLSPVQARNFIPVYNEYEREVRDARQYFFRKYRGTNSGNADDATSLQFVDDNLDYQQRVIDIRRKYNEQFLKILSPRQLADLSNAEREFKQILIKRLDRQRGRGRFINRRQPY